MNPLDMPALWRIDRWYADGVRDAAAAAEDCAAA